MGKKKTRRERETRLERKLRKLEKAQRRHRTAALAAHVEVSEAAEAVVPAEVQLGGSDVLGSLAQVPPASPDQRAPADAAPTPESVAAEAPAGEPGGDGRTRGPFGIVGDHPSREVFRVIQDRRSHKRFLAAPVPKRALEVMLEAAVLAPNHKLTEPWSFVVLGPAAKRQYGEIRARHKAGDDADPAKRRKIVEEVVAIPTILVVKLRVDEDAVRREEDYAATFMAVENLMLAATALGLGTKITTGRIMDHIDVRALVNAAEDERIVALINVGVPAETRGPGRRTAAKEKTTWLP
jgi:nitroreductase